MKVIANLGINWFSKGEPEERAQALVEGAKEAGVHGVCIPYLRSENLYANQEIVKKIAQYDMTDSLFALIARWAERAGLEIWVTPYWWKDVKFMEEHNVDGYHVPNGSLGYTPLLEAIRKTERPVMVSTGFATMPEISDAVDFLAENRSIHNLDLTLLHSTGAMPTPLHEVQLRVILDLIEEFYPVEVGYEPFTHHESHFLDYIAMAYYPSVVMRRFDLEDRQGLETEYSLDPHQLKALVLTAEGLESIRDSELYEDTEFVKGDWHARRKQLRCANSDYLIPSER
jgi:sialic acid synthase SpsE